MQAHTPRGRTHRQGSECLFGYLRFDRTAAGEE